MQFDSSTSSRSGSLEVSTTQMEIQQSPREADEVAKFAAVQAQASVYFCLPAIEAIANPHDKTIGRFLVNVVAAHGSVCAMSLSVNAIRPGSPPFAWRRTASLEVSPAGPHLRIDRSPHGHSRRLNTAASSERPAARTRSIFSENARLPIEGQHNQHVA